MFSLFERFKQWRRARIVRRYPIPDNVWKDVLQQLPLANQLTSAQHRKLRELSTLFMHEKRFYGGGDLDVEPKYAVIIAAQASFAALSLGYDWLSGWSTVIVYPGHFRTRRSYRDADGVAHYRVRRLSGEASADGGIVLSLQDVLKDIAIEHDGSNVVLHEIAHKLDMRNGRANGFPPLHKGMSRRQWTETMQNAFDDLTRQLQRSAEPDIDPYAATNPAEFFAVTSEYFFERPQYLESCYPEVFDQLARFYKLDPRKLHNPPVSAM